MSGAVIADTGPLLAAVDRDDQYHNRAQAEVGRLGDESRLVLIPYPILFECYSLVLRRLGIAAAHVWLRETTETALPSRPSTEDLVAAVGLVRGYQDQPITLFDAVAAVMSKRLSTPVWTFDYHFDILGVEVWRY